VRPRKIRVLHDGKEYHLLDSGQGRRSRTLTLIRRREPGDGEEAQTFATDLGECVALASWRQGEIAVEPGHEDLREPFGRIVARYLEEFRTGRARDGAKTCFFLTVDRQPLYTLDRSQPHGIAVLIFADRKDARRAAEARRGIESRPIEVEESGDLADFLAARAAEGFCGALLDERHPIYFLGDSDGNIRFLKVGCDPESGEIQHHLLDERGEWRIYDGEQELTLEIDQELLDDHMTERLGEVPFLGFHDRVTMYRLRRRSGDDGPVVVHLDDEDEAPVCPLFHDVEGAETFLAEHLIEDCELVAVDDLAAFTAGARAVGAVVRVEPDAHRARGAVMWQSNGALVLDSFSGVWVSHDGGHSFVKEAAG
jgi:hypothetical protein